MNAVSLKQAMSCVSDIMSENKDYLVMLDQRNGDGDLGISMAAGFKAASEALEASEEADLGKLLLKTGSVFNEAAPSSLGTILSFGMMGMAKVLRGKSEITLEELADALIAGVERIMEKAKSKPGEKTVLDALYPAAQALKQNCGAGKIPAFRTAAQAAAAGSEATRQMKAVHGRAVYYGENSIGVLDGGSVVGKLLFEALYGCAVK